MDGVSPAAVKAFFCGDLENFIVAATPGGIGRQELEGQKQLVNAEVTRLPKNILDGDRDFAGMKVSEIYAQAGIEVIGEFDDIFLNVKLPTGWKLIATEHSMWSSLVDDKERRRAAVFYKASFYDRNAHFNFTPRFRVAEEPEDGGNNNASYEDRKKMKRYGRVYEGDKVVFETAGRKPIKVESGSVNSDAYIAYQKQKEELYAECKAWLRANGYTEYTDPLKCWD